MHKEINAYIDSYMNDYRPYHDGRWCYEDGVLMTAIFDLYQVTKDSKYYDFVYKYYDSMIDKDGNISTYDLDYYSLDDICPGICLVKLYRFKKEERFKKALDILFNQALKHPRTKEGSFWHKKIYPNQVWLDGVYMGVLFIALYAKEFDIQSVKEDVDNQLHILLDRLYDKDRKLFVHAYDEAKLMQWADKNTGKSPNVWSRAFGWMIMAIVDIYDELKLDICVEILSKAIEGVKPYLEEKMLYQIIDVRNDRNYLETSGSCMFAYGLLKAKRLGMLDEYSLGMDIFNSILDKKFDGKNLKDICLVAGLDNTRRNGSFDYYMSEPVVDNEAKGVAPFIMAYSETI